MNRKEQLLVAYMFIGLIRLLISAIVATHPFHTQSMMDTFMQESNDLKEREVALFTVFSKED